MTADLAAFLRARLDEGEKIARSSHKLKHIWNEPCPLCGLAIEGYSVRPGEVVGVTIRHQNTSLECEIDSNAWRSFIDDGLTDQAKFMLADIDAKRRIIDECEPGPALGQRVLRFLALPWRDHADYRQEWTP